LAIDSIEKFILDIEMLQMMAKYLEPVEVNDTTLAFEEIKSVGHGGHFFYTENTIKITVQHFMNPLLLPQKLWAMGRRR
jgi:trimethylamine--corrinoid protein Co-methyltransferase